MSSHKDTFRNNLLQKLKDFIFAWWDQYIVEHIITHPKIKSAQTVCMYISMDTEVSTILSIQKLMNGWKKICVPKLLDGKMTMVELESLKDVSVGTFKIIEPIQTKVNTQKIDCALIPGVCFTESGSRIGKWKGYYDVWLSENPDIYKIGLCYDFQMIPEFKKDQWDIDMNEIIIIST